MSNKKGEAHPFHGYQRTGLSQGKYNDEAGIPRYLVRPVADIQSVKYLFEDQSVALLVFPDENGICYDSMMLADGFAAAGLHTTVLSYNGIATLQDSPTKDMKLSPARAEKAIEDYISKELVGKKSSTVRRTRILLVGYGSGAKHVLRLLAQPDGKDDWAYVAGFIASPSPDIEISAYQRVNKPLSLAFADDPITSMPSYQRERIREALFKAWVPSYQMNIYSHARDNFAVTCAFANTGERYAKRKAFSQALQWFYTHLNDKI